MFRRILAVTLTAACCAVVPVTAEAAPPPAPSPAPADPVSACKLPYRGAFSEGMPTDWNYFLRPIGTMRVAMIFRGYSDPAAEFARHKPAFENLFRTMSYGRLNIELVRVPVQAQLSKAGQQSLDKHGNDPDRVGDIVTDTQQAAWQDAVRRVDPYYNFAQDTAVIYLDTSIGRSYAQVGSIVADGKTLKGGPSIGNDWQQARPKLVGHEFGHHISLPDQYGGSGGFGYTGGWGIMGNLGGPSPDFFAWEKWKLGWLDDPQMTCVRTLNSAAEATLTPLETAGGMKGLVVRYSETQAYVAEVRSRGGVNSGSCDTGVLIYWIDSARASGSGPVLVRDARPGSGGCGGHELNDGAYDPGQAFTDSANQVRFQVLSQNGSDYVVRATYGTATPGTPVYSDDFESDKGWTVNAAGTDTATAGKWERGDPEATTWSGRTYQLGTVTSGTSDLVTGRLAGTDAGTHDVDGGVTSIRSPEIELPADGKLTLSLRQYLAHADNAAAEDHLKVIVTGTSTATVFEQSASAATHRAGSWGSATADLSSFAGQKIRIMVQAADAGTPSMIEAGIDDVRITKS